MARRKEARRKDLPSLAEVWEVVQTPKRIGDPVSGLVAELATSGECFRSNKLGKSGLWWGIKLYREKQDTRLRAVFQVNSWPIIGLDYHRLTSWDNHLGVRIGNGYHWDIYRPLVADKFKFLNHSVSLSIAVLNASTDTLQNDRAALAAIFKICHIRHERETQKSFKNRRR